MRATPGHLVRLRLQSSEPALLPEGRPFLDIAAALTEVARGCHDPAALAAWRAHRRRIAGCGVAGAATYVTHGLWLGGLAVVVWP